MRLGCAIAFAACVGLGCASTTLGGSEARVPVLLGPVPCMGCAPKSAAPVTTASMPVRASQKGFACLLCLPNGYIGHTEQGTAIAKHGDYLGVPDCGGALQLSGLRARAWTFAIPPFFWLVDHEIDGDVTAVRVGAGPCAHAP